MQKYEAPEELNSSWNNNEMLQEAVGLELFLKRLVEFIQRGEGQKRERTSKKYGDQNVYGIIKR